MSDDRAFLDGLEMGLRGEDHQPETGPAGDFEAARKRLEELAAVMLPENAAAIACVLEEADRLKDELDKARDLYEANHG